MSKHTVAVIDYGLGNLFSIKHMCNHIGLDVTITSCVDEIMDADALILPGVGAYGDAMLALEENGLKDVIFDFVKTGKPMLGICLGMQLLFDKSLEFGERQGLGLIPGIVRKFENPKYGGQILKVPQVCWNKVYQPDQGNWNSDLLENIPNGEYFYFVHSYYVEADKAILCNSVYGDITFCSGVNYENIYGVQFHPERSGEAGVQFYKNFMTLISKEKGVA